MAQTIVTPIVTPKATEVCLPYVLPHIEEIMEDYGELADADISAVLNDLLTGNTILYLVFHESRFAGFFILRIINFKVSEPYPLLYIDFAWKNPEIDFDFSEAVEPTIVKYAKRNGCKEIRCKVKDESLAEKLMKFFNATKGLTEYRRKV